MPKFTFKRDGTVVRTVSCEECGVEFSYTEASRRRFCDACRAARKKRSDDIRRGVEPAPVKVSSPDYGRGTDWACLNRPGRCEATDCRHHLGFDLGPDCAVRIANEQGAVTQEQVGRLLGVTKERIRQLEEAALKRIRKQEG